MAKRGNSTLQAVRENAVALQQRHLVLKRANTAYAKLRADKRVWANWKRDLHQLDSTVHDGI